MPLSNESMESEAMAMLPLANGAHGARAGMGTWATKPT
jgi:hypothetical protein